MKKIFFLLVIAFFGATKELYAQNWTSKWIDSCYYFKQQDNTTFCKVKFFEKDTCPDINKRIASYNAFYLKDVQDVSNGKALHDSLYRFYYHYFGAEPLERLHILQVCTYISVSWATKYSLTEKKNCACLTGNFENVNAHFSFVPLYDMETLTGYKMPKYLINNGYLGTQITDNDTYLTTTKQWQERIKKQGIAAQKGTICYMDMPLEYTDLKILDNYIRRGIYERICFAEFIFLKLNFSERLYNIVKLDLDILCKTKTSTFFIDEKINTSKLKKSLRKWRASLKKINSFY